MTTHEIKCWPKYFDATEIDHKTFDLRRNDRDYKVGDTVVLREWHPDKQEYTGRQMTRQISYVLEGGDTSWVDGDDITRRGLRTGYVILGFHRCAS